MGSGPMIILAVAFQNPAEMIFIDHDHMVEALSPETSNHPLHERILPGTPGCRDHFFDPHPLYPPAKLFPVNLVAIPDQKPRSALFGESFNHLTSSLRAVPERFLKTKSAPEKGSWSSRFLQSATSESIPLRKSTGS